MSGASSTNDPITLSLLIITLPLEIYTTRTKITLELHKCGIKVMRSERKEKRKNVVLVEAAEDQMVIEEFCLERNGRLEVDGVYWRMDTLRTFGREWEVQEGPSPLRLASRPPSTSAEYLRDVYAFFHPLEPHSSLSFPLETYSFLETCVQAPPLLPPPSPGSGLGLPFPYNLLPDTPFFRSCLVVPPPLFPSEVSTLQRIINRYHSSFMAHNERQERELEQWYEMMCPQPLFFFFPSSDEPPPPPMTPPPPPPSRKNSRSRRRG